MKLSDRPAASSRQSERCNQKNVHQKVLKFVFGILSSRSVEERRERDGWYMDLHLLGI